MFQVLNKVTGGKPRATRRSSGGRRVILKALKVKGCATPVKLSFSKQSRNSNITHCGNIFVR